MASRCDLFSERLKVWKSTTVRHFWRFFIFRIGSKNHQKLFQISFGRRCEKDLLFSSIFHRFWTSFWDLQKIIFGWKKNLRGPEGANKGSPESSRTRAFWLSSVFIEFYTLGTFPGTVWGQFGTVFAAFEGALCSETGPLAIAVMAVSKMTPG